jgi:cell division protein FtsW
MYKKIDYYILIPIILLSLFGLLMVYSASNVVALDDYNDSFYYFKRQLLFMVVGVIIMFIITKIDINKIKYFSVFIFLFCLLLLILVLIPGIGVIRGGARSWIGIGTFSIQPSEFMKVGIILLFSKYLINNYNDVKNTKYFIYLSIIVIFVFLLIMLQPDFGTGLVILLSCFCFLFIAGANYKLFIIIGVIGILGIGALIVSAPYRFERIIAYLDPWSDPLGSGFQGIQSLFAITPGGLFGHGFNNSIQKHFFLPEPQNDFIFAIIIEEFGLIGGMIVLCLYFMIIYRCFKISKNLDDNYCKFLLLGLSLTLSIQVFINIGVVIGLLPVTGITLPLFSYGGSSLLINYISFGIILNSSKYRNL